MRRIGIMGAAFNPPTLGHKDLIEQALVAVDEVWLVPSYMHAFSKRMLSYDYRCSLLVDFARDLAEEPGIGDRVKAMPLEHLIYRGGPVYTWDLLCYAQGKYGSEAELVFLMGPDNLANWQNFHRSEEISEQWEIFVAQETKHIRSTLVRDAIEKGLPFGDMVTQRVGERIENLGYYRVSGNE